MEHREAAFGKKFRHWLRSRNIKLPTAGFELKHTRGKDYLPFTDVSEGQLNYANAIRSLEGTLIRVQGGNGEPDYIWMREEPVFVVVEYPDFFAIISSVAFEEEKARNTRKSLTGERAKQIAWQVII